MNKEEILKTIKNLREKSPTKNFLQSVDLVLNLQNLDLKKPDNKVDIYIQLPHAKGKKVRLGAFVDSQLESKAKNLFDTLILKQDFPKWINNKKEQRILANSHDFFLAQADLMTQVAAAFGKVLGARGKMPDPKAGCVVPGTIPTLEPIAKKLQNTIRLATKNETTIKASIGLEKMKDEELADNVIAVYNAVLAKLPQEKNNIKYLALKFTMGPLFKVEEVQKKK